MAGTDQFGNTFPQGLSVLVGEFAGTDFMINADGLFFYNGTPALGSLIISMAPIAGGTDAYGNNYPQGTNFGIWSAATGDIENHFGIDAGGNIYLANSSDNTVLFGESGDALLFYNSAGQAAGNLRASVAPVSGTDAYSNTYPAGLATVVPGTTGEPAGMQGTYQISLGDLTGSFGSLPGISFYNQTIPYSAGGTPPAIIGLNGATATGAALFLSSGQSESIDSAGSITIASNSGAVTLGNPGDGNIAFTGTLSPFEVVGAITLLNISTPPRNLGGPVIYGGSGHLAVTGSDGNSYDTEALHVNVYPGQVITSTGGINVTGASAAVGAAHYLNVYPVT